MSKDGDVVTFGIFADPITDPDEDGIGSFDFTLNHDALDMQIDAGSLVFATGLSGLQNYDADSGTLTAGAFTLNNVEDLDAPLLTFEATMLDTKAPISIQITDIVVDGDDFASTTEVFDFSALAITTNLHGVSIFEALSSLLPGRYHCYILCIVRLHKRFITAHSRGNFHDSDRRRHRQCIATDRTAAGH